MSVFILGPETDIMDQVRGPKSDIYVGLGWTDQFVKICVEEEVAAKFDCPPINQ